MKKNLLFSLFLWTLFIWISQGALFPEFSLFPWASWLSATLLLTSWTSSLWLAALGGVACDLFSDAPFAIHAIGFTLITALWHRLRRYFLFENLFHWALLSSLLSFSFTALFFILLFLFDKRAIFAGKWFLLDWTIMPLVDGVYTLLLGAAIRGILRARKQLFLP